MAFCISLTTSAARFPGSSPRTAAMALLSIRSRSEPLDDRGVGHPAAFAHGLQAVAAAGGLKVVQQRGHQLGSGAAERVAQGDRAAARVEPVLVGTELLRPGQRDRRERLVDLVSVD